jgi:hypothetical protein
MICSDVLDGVPVCPGQRRGDAASKITSIYNRKRPRGRKGMKQGRNARAA